MDSGMFWQKLRLVFIYEIVINKMIVNMFITILSINLPTQLIKDI